MGADDDGAPVRATWVVECYWPGITEDRLRSAVARCAGDGSGPVRYRGALLLNRDETALVLFEADSEAAVRAASERAGLPFERVVECTAIAGVAGTAPG